MKVGVLIFSLFCAFRAWGLISPEDYRNQVQAHRERVGRLAAAAYDQFRHHLPPVKYYILLGYLDLHDRPKTQSLAQLYASGYAHDETINDRLARFYGQDREQMPEIEQARLFRLIINLNFVEARQKSEFFLRHGVEAPARFTLEWIEEIADVTDTKISRTRELDIKPSEKSASRYFQTKKNDLFAAEVAEWLESHYSRIVNPQAFCSGWLRR